MRTSTELKQFKREMRSKRATPAEKVFRARLVAANLPFVCQCIIGFFIVDFALPRRMLVIELDGSSHKGREDYDRNRDQFLRLMGFQVLRVPNSAAKRMSLNTFTNYALRPSDREFRSALGRAQAARGKAIQREREAATLGRLVAEAGALDVEFARLCEVG